MYNLLTVSRAQSLVSGMGASNSRGGALVKINNFSTVVSTTGVLHCGRLRRWADST